MKRLTARLKREIGAFALGSLYRMNAGSADCYVFTLYKNSKGKLDFEGGWDWSNHLIDESDAWSPEWSFNLKTKEFKALKNSENKVVK